MQHRVSQRRKRLLGTTMFENQDEEGSILKGLRRRETLSAPLSTLIKSGWYDLATFEIAWQSGLILFKSSQLGSIVQALDWRQLHHEPTSNLLILPNESKRNILKSFPSNT